MIMDRLNKVLGRELLANILKRLNEISDVNRSNYDELKRKLDNFANCDSYLSTELLGLKKQNNKKDILITGYYGAQNCGDELMLEALRELIDRSKYNVYLLAAPNYSLDTSYYYPDHVIHYPKRVNDIAFISDFFDTIIWGGGAVLDDIRYRYCENNDNDLTYISMKITKSMIMDGKDALILGVSTNGELKDTRMVTDLKYIIDNSKFFSLRDTNSLKTLRKAGVPCTKIKIIDDIALSNIYDTHDNINRSKTNRMVIGFILLMNDESKDYLTAFINKVIKAMDGVGTIRLISFYNHDSHDVRYFDYLKNNIEFDGNIEIEDPIFKTHNICEALGKCDIIFSMRYHATLLSGYVLGKKVISINYGSVHRHYLNKMKYLKQKYIKNLVSIDYQDLCDDRKIKQSIESIKKIDYRPVSKKDLTNIRQKTENILRENLL